MLPKKRKISRKLFDNQKKNSRSETGQTKKIEIKNFNVLVVKYLGESKFSIIISRKLIKSAVERNHIRRKFFNTIKNLSIKSGFLFFFYLKNPLADLNLKELEYQIMKFFKEQKFLLV